MVIRKSVLAATLLAVVAVTALKLNVPKTPYAVTLLVKVPIAVEATVATIVVVEVSPGFRLLRVHSVLVVEMKVQVP